MGGCTQMQAAAIKRDHALLTNDGRKGCAYILQYRDDRFGNSCSVSIGTSTVRQISYDLAALFA